ncbi:unnamed protein product, partial [marine sediment metagenome]
HCQIRWFYFWASIGEAVALSTTAWFKKHYTWTAPPPEPECLVFNSDKHVEVSSVDGFVFRAYNDGQSWNAILTGAGNGVSDRELTLLLQIGPADETPGLWRVCVRSPMLFDISAIPAGSEIVSAKMSLYQTGMIDELFISAWFYVGIYESYPASNTVLVKADYSRFNAVCLTDNPLLLDDILHNAWNDMTLNEAGVAVLQTALDGEGIAKLGIREKTYDADGAIPPWISQKYSLWRCASGDSSSFKPKLEICFLPP